MLLLCLAAGATALLGRRAGRTFVLVAAGLALCAVADAARLLEGIEVRAPLAALVRRLRRRAARRDPPPLRPRRRRPRRPARRVHARRARRAGLGPPGRRRSATSAIDLALAVPFLLVLRLAVSLQENARLLERSRDEALTDALTGLGNRRALMRALSDALEAAVAGRRYQLALFDLDGFKAYNDVFGHVAGDVLIEHLGGRLAASVKGVGRAFRMGGDEFCVLVPAERATAALVRAGEALREEGEGFRIDASVGVVELPGDVADAEAALQLADRRMYAQKEGRPNSPARQSGDVLLRVIGEREPELLAHTRAVAELSRALASAMGLDAETRETVARAAELHDVGKVAVPDAILSKPGPLDDGRGGVHAPPHRDRRVDHRRGARAARGRGARAGEPRALGRHGLPRQPGRPRDPARGADRLRLRRLQRDAPAAPVRRGARRGGGARRAAPRRRQPVRPGARRGVLRPARIRRRQRALHPRRPPAGSGRAGARRGPRSTEAA